MSWATNYKRHVAVKWDAYSRPTEIHIIRVPPLVGYRKRGAPNGYQPRRSLGAFRNREVTRFADAYTARKTPKHGFTFHVHDAQEWLRNERMERRLEHEARRAAGASKPFRRQHRGLPIYKHDDVYAFYRAVGWDWKRKLWTSEPIP